MVKNEIVISKKEIFKKYSKLDLFFRSNIEQFYDNSQMINVDELLNNENNLIKFTRKKTGVYIFIDERGYPKYIGKGGTSKKKKGKDLFFRIQQELSCGHKHSTLCNNIISIEGILQNKSLSKEDAKKIMKKLKLIILVNTVRVEDDEIQIDSIHKVEALETLLIALYNSTYNK